MVWLIVSQIVAVLALLPWTLFWVFSHSQEH